MDLLDTLNIVIKSIEKFVMVPEKNFLLKNSNFFRIKLFESDLNFSFSKPPILRWFFFRGPLQIFLWILWLCSRYLKDPPKVVLYASKKIMTVQRTNTIVCQEKWKRFGFWNLKLRLWPEYSDKTTVFEVKLFFREPLEIFLNT